MEIIGQSDLFEFQEIQETEKYPKNTRTNSSSASDTSEFIYEQSDMLSSTSEPIYPNQTVKRIKRSSLENETVEKTPHIKNCYHQPSYGQEMIGQVNPYALLIHEEMQQLNGAKLKCFKQELLTLIAKYQSDN